MDRPRSLYSLVYRDNPHIPKSVDESDGDKLVGAPGAERHRLLSLYSAAKHFAIICSLVNTMLMAETLYGDYELRMLLRMLHVEKDRGGRSF